LRDGQVAEADLLKLLLLVARHWDANSYQTRPRGALEDLLGTSAGKKSRGRSGEDVLADVLDGGDVDAMKLAAGLAAALLFDLDGDRGPCEMAHPEEIEQLVAYFAIDLVNAWYDDQAGPLSEGYWNLHTKDQLAGLAEELGVELADGATKADMVRAFLARRPAEPGKGEDYLEMPKELKAKAGKRKR